MTSSPNTPSPSDWEKRLAETDARGRQGEPAAWVESIDALVAERPEVDAVSNFERGSVRDSVGMEVEAAEFYQAALAMDGLDDYRRARATLQLGSTLRILGHLDESARLLREELVLAATLGDMHPLSDESRATLALTLIAQGKSDEAAAHALIALAPHLSRYQRAVKGNAEEILDRSAYSPTDS